MKLNELIVVGYGCFCNDVRKIRNVYELKYWMIETVWKCGMWRIIKKFLQQIFVDIELFFFSFTSRGQTLKMKVFILYMDFSLYENRRYCSISLRIIYHSSFLLFYVIRKSLCNSKGNELLLWYRQTLEQEDEWCKIFYDCSKYLYIPSLLFSTVMDIFEH